MSLSMSGVAPSVGERDVEALTVPLTRGCSQKLLGPRMFFQPRRRFQGGLKLLPAVFGMLMLLAVMPSGPWHQWRQQLSVRARADDFGAMERRDVRGDLALTNKTSSPPPPPPKVEEKCEEPYGVLPCSDKVVGTLFLMAVYGYLLLLAARMISDGSELLLEVLNPGLIGGLLLPTLGAFPDALLIAVSCLGGDLAKAKEQVFVGVGVLAGSTVMILTLLWGGCVMLGRCDLEGTPPVAKDRTLTHGWDPLKTGVTCDAQTTWGALVMIITVIPYIIVSIPGLHGKKIKFSEASLASLLGCIAAGVLLVGYFIYQVAVPSLQQMRIREARLHLLRTNALQSMHRLSVANSWGGLLLRDHVTPNVEVLGSMFDKFDEDSSGELSLSELRALIVGLGLQEAGKVPDSTQVKDWLREFDLNNDEKIGRDEFINGLARWIRKVRQSRLARLVSKGPMEIVAAADAPVEQGEAAPATPVSTSSAPMLTQPSDGVSPRRPSVWDQHSVSAAEHLRFLQEDLAEEEEDEEEGGEHKEKTHTQIYMEAAFWIFAGVAVVTVFADPMVDAVNSFSKASGIPAFFVGFVVTPLASNASEVVSSLIFAMKKRKRTTSLTLSQVYGAITMNNTLCMCVFLAVVYYRGLVWEFSAETTGILIVTAIIGVLGGTRTTFPLWMAYPAILLYPACLGLVAFLDYGLGWK